jgi:hypothetical protein
MAQNEVRRGFHPCYLIRQFYHHDGQDNENKNVRRESRSVSPVRHESRRTPDNHNREAWLPASE